MLDKLKHLLLKRWFLVSALILVMLGSVVRLVNLGIVPSSLYWDEAAMLVDARAVAATGRDMYGNSAWLAMFLSYGDYKLPVYIWLVSGAVWLCGTAEWVVRLPSALTGILQIILIGLITHELLTWKFFAKKTSRLQEQLIILSTMSVLAFSPWSIVFSRTGFEGHVGQFLVTFAVFCLLKARNRVWWIIPAALVGALAVYTYYSVRFVWPVIYLGFWLLLLTQYLRKNFESIKQSLSQNVFKMAKYGAIVIGGLILWGVLLQPLYQSIYYQPSQQYRLSATSILNATDYPLESNILREIGGNGIFSRLFYHRYFLLGQELLINYAQHLRVNYLFINGDANLRHGTGQNGLFVLALLPFLVIGGYQLVRKFPNVFVFITLWWLIALLPASVPEEVPHALRSLNAMTPLVFLIGFGVGNTIYSSFQSKNLLLKLFTFSVLFLCFVQTGLFFEDYYRHYPLRSADAWQSGYRELADYLISEKDNVEQIHVHIGDHRFYLWLLNQPEVSATSLANLPYQDNSLYSYQNILFQQQPPILNDIEENTLVITQVGQLPEEIDKVTEITDSLGVARFAVGRY